MAKLPLMSLWAVPMSTEAPLESIALSFTVTPFAVPGIVCCSYMYAIHALMSLSDMAGVPFAPGDWSITVPCITTLEPLATAVSGDSTVTADGPLPKQ